MQKKYSFVDLFSGIGGFHQAMSSFGGKCVFASEIDPAAIKVYLENYGIDSGKNIRDVRDEDIPDHDVLCAGFPCQAFSKAGKQLGFMDKIRGTLFFEVARILKAKHPKYIILENVKNLTSHDEGNTYRTICETLRELGYRIPKEPLILSPHQFGIPHIRERLFIPGVFDPKNSDQPLDFTFDKLLLKENNSIDDILENDACPDYCKLNPHTLDVLTAWDEFYHGLDVKTIGFPVWASFLKTDRIDPKFPKWKQDFVRKNQELYRRNKTFIDSWLKKWNNLRGFTPTQKKFEWQCGEKISSLWEGIIQIRPSGVRVKKPDAFQALVALVQTPIVGKYKRKLTVREAARLQSFPEEFKPDNSPLRAYKQFGNSVNVVVVQNIFKKLIEVEK